MLKLSTKQTLRLIHATSSKERAAIKLAHLLGNKMEKQAFLGLSTAAIWGIINALSIAGSVGYGIYSGLKGDGSKAAPAQPQPQPPAPAPQPAPQPAAVQPTQPPAPMPTPQPRPQPRQQPEAPARTLSKREAYAPQISSFLSSINYNPTQSRSRMAGTGFGTKRASVGGLEKQAFPFLSIIAMFARTLASQGGRAAAFLSKKLMSHATRTMLSSGARGAAGQLGRGVGAVQRGVGGLLQRAPGLSGYGANMATRGAVSGAFPAAAGAQALRGAGNLAGSVAGTAGQMGTIGYGMNKLHNYLNAPPTIDYNDPQLMAAMKEREYWDNMEQRQTGLEAYRPQSVSNFAPMPGYDLTQIPMGGYDAPDSSNDQTG